MGGEGETEGESNKNPRYKHEEAIFGLDSTKTEASSKPPNEKLHKKSPILHTATKLYNPSGFMNSSNNGDSEIGLLKSKFAKFADNGTTKLADLVYKLNSIKENKPYPIVVLKSVIDELKKEKSELWKAIHMYTYVCHTL